LQNRIDEEISKNNLLQNELTHLNKMIENAQYALKYEKEKNKLGIVSTQHTQHANKKIQENNENIELKSNTTSTKNLNNNSLTNVEENNFINNLKTKMKSNLASKISNLNTKFNSDINNIMIDEKLHNEAHNRHKKINLLNFYENVEQHGQRLKTEDDEMVHPKMSYLSNRDAFPKEIYKSNKLNTNSTDEFSIVSNPNETPYINYERKQDGERNRIKQKFNALKEKRERSKSKEKDEKENNQFGIFHQTRNKDYEITDLENLIFQYQEEKQHVINYNIIKYRSLMS